VLELREVYMFDDNNNIVVQKDNLKNAFWALKMAFLS